MAVVLLLDMEQSPPTDFSPSGHTVTVGSGASLNTTDFKFNEASFKFDGTSNGYLQIANSSDFLFEDGDFTVECWAYWDTLPDTGGQHMLSVWNSSGSQISWGLQLQQTVGGEYRAFILGTTDGITIDIHEGASDISPTTVADTWYHVATTRENDTIRTFFNGTQCQEIDATGLSFFNSNTALRIGNRVSQPSTTAMNGSIDNVRITKGLAVYTKDFTPPDNFFNANSSNLLGWSIPFLPNLRAGRAVKKIKGSLFEDSDTFNTGDVRPQNLFGSLLEDADILNGGILDAPAPGNQGIIRSTFLNSSSLFHGIVRPTNMFGSLLDDSDTLNDGEIGGSRQLEGSILEDGDDLYHGRIVLSLQDLEGSVLEDADTLHHGALSFGDINISGSKLGDSILVLDSVTTNSAMIESSHSINIPNGSNRTDRKLIVAVSANNSVTYTWPSSWTELLDTTTGDVSLSIAHKTIDGTEGFGGSNDTITVTTSESKIVTAIAYLINENFGDIEIDSTTGTSTSPDPPSLTPSNGYDNYLNIAVIGHDAGSTSTTAYPSGFVNNQAVRAGILTTGCGIAGSHLIEPGSSIDPSAFTISQNRSWIAATISVRSTEPALDNIIYHGSMIPEIAGTILTDSDTFNHGTVYKGVRVTSSQRNYRAGHENPGVYTLDNSNDWIAVTVAIR